MEAARAVATTRAERAGLGIVRCRKGQFVGTVAEDHTGPPATLASAKAAGTQRISSAARRIPVSRATGWPEPCQEED